MSMSMPSGLNGKDTKPLKTENPGNSTSVFPKPKSVSRGLQSPQTSGAIPSNSRGALQHGTSRSVSCRGPLDGDVSARVVEVLLHIDCTCGVQRQNYDLIVEMPLRPHSGDPSFRDWRCWGCCRKHTTCNTGRITSPQFCNHGELNFLDSEPKCHETARFRFTDRHKTSITRMSMPSGLNGKHTKHLKNANLGNSTTSVVPDPKSVSRRLQSPQTSGTVPSNSRGALQSAAPPSRLDDDPSTEMLPPEWSKFLLT